MDSRVQLLLNYYGELAPHHTFIARKEESKKPLVLHQNPTWIGDTCLHYGDGPRNFPCKRDSTFSMEKLCFAYTSCHLHREIFPMSSVLRVHLASLQHPSDCLDLTLKEVQLLLQLFKEFIANLSSYSRKCGDKEGIIAERSLTFPKRVETAAISPGTYNLSCTLYKPFGYFREERNNVIVGLQLLGGDEQLFCKEPVYLRLDAFEEKKLSDLTTILTTLYGSSKKRGNQKGVDQNQLFTNSLAIRELLTHYGLSNRLKFFPRLHETEKDSLLDLPRFYPKGYKEKREREEELHSVVDYQVSKVSKSSALCMELFLKSGGTDVAKVRKIQRKYKRDLREIRKEINEICRQNRL